MQRGISQVWRIRVGDVHHWSLSRHEDAFIMETLQHLQRTVGKHHLLWGDLQRERRVTWPCSSNHNNYVKKYYVTLSNLKTLPWPVCPTWTSSRWDSCSAFWCLWQLPALVTNTTGNRKLLFWSTIFRNARWAAGITEPPRSRTPSTSKRTPTWWRRTDRQG